MLDNDSLIWDYWKSPWLFLLALTLCMYVCSFWNDCSSFIFSNPVSVRGYINNDLTKANNEVIRRHVYSALIDQKDDGMRKVLMYASARNSIPPLGFEEKIQLDYRSDGSSTFFAETCLLKLQVPVVFDSFNEFYKQFIFAVDNCTKALDVFNMHTCANYYFLCWVK